MKGEFRTAGRLVVQILAVIIIFSAAVYGLWRINIIRLPEFIEGIFISSEDTHSEYVNDGYEIFEYIGKSDTEAMELPYPEITPDNLASLLSSIEPYENFYWESKAEVFYGDASSAVECKSRISGSRYNIEILSKQGKTVRKCISDGTKTVITSNSGNGTETQLYQRGLTDFYSDASIISVDNFLNTYLPAANTEIMHVVNEGYELVSVLYTYDRNGVSVRNNYLISLDYGVVLFAECFENDTLVYRLSTNSIYSLSSLDSELFQTE